MIVVLRSAMIVVLCAAMIVVLRVANPRLPVSGLLHYALQALISKPGYGNLFL